MSHAGNINSFILDVYETLKTYTNNKQHLHEGMFDIISAMEDHYIIDGDIVRLEDCLGEDPILDSVINDFLDINNEDDFEEDADDGEY